MAKRKRKVVDKTMKNETSFTNTFIEAEKGLFQEYLMYEMDPVIQLAKELHISNSSNDWDRFVFYPNMMDKNGENKFILLNVHYENEDSIQKQNLAEFNISMLFGIKQYVSIFYGSMNDMDCMVLVFFDFEKNSEKSVYIPLKNNELIMDSIIFNNPSIDNGHPNITGELIRQQGSYLAAAAEFYGKMIKADPIFLKILVQRVIEDENRIKSCN